MVDILRTGNVNHRVICGEYALFSPHGPSQRLLKLYKHAESDCYGTSFIGTTAPRRTALQIEGAEQLGAVALLLDPETKK